MIDLLLPVIVLIGSAIGAMIYTGFLGGATDVVSAFAGCDAETSLIFATMVTVFVMLFLYLPRKVVTFKGFMESFVEGFKLMIPAIGILIFAWTLKGMGDALQIGTFVESIVGTSASASLFLPAVLFVVAVFLAFSTGTSWGTFAILVPIAIAMFPGADHLEMMIIAVSAVLAGAVCGDHISPISDTTVMSSAGAQSNHINHVTTQMQSEFIKICFIITFSKHLSWLREKKMIEKFSGVLFLALHAMIPMAIIHIQGDDGTVLIFALMFLVMTFAAGVQLRYFVIFGGLLVCAIPIIWNMFMNEEHRNRVLALFDLDGNALTNYGWQQYQGKVSIASGEAFGSRLLHEQRVK